ncbi:hypothetical protein XELAEV_18034630mg [Xenopus laevis]|uniref:Uncharacterized protein n=1 Tax=Xenopus laevis TaxID=8355 RepID=A0A974CGH2_XENLA|nr:hypothetical protein XELAEV_18034630mg [Xenopus laevis]
MNKLNSLTFRGFSRVVLPGPSDLVSAGIFFYKGHPIKQVDVLGTVVYVREKEHFYSYGDPGAKSLLKEDPTSRPVILSPAASTTTSCKEN